MNVQDGLLGFPHAGGSFLSCQLNMVSVLPCFFTVPHAYRKVAPEEDERVLH